MEIYCQLTIQLKDIELRAFKTQVLEVLSTMEILSESEVLEGNQFLVGFMGGSNLSEKVESLLYRLREKGIENAWMFEHADEDPECTLHKLADKRITKVVCDFNLYDVIAELDYEDLPESLREPLELGPEKYFTRKYKDWSSGLEPMKEHWDYKERIEDIISYC